MMLLEQSLLRAASSWRLATELRSLKSVHLDPLEKVSQLCRRATELQMEQSSAITTVLIACRIMTQTISTLVRFQVRFLPCEYVETNSVATQRIRVSASVQALGERGIDTL